MGSFKGIYKGSIRFWGLRVLGVWGFRGLGTVWNPDVRVSSLRLSAKGSRGF